jgi:hypothetical protein
MIGVNTSCRAAIPGGGEWPGQALQDDTIPQGVGEWPLTIPTLNLQYYLPPGRSVIDKKQEKGKIVFPEADAI